MNIRQVKFLLSIILVVLFFLTIRTVLLALLSFTPDFSVMWIGAVDLLNNMNPYVNEHLFTGIGYPPFSLIFYLPFALLHYSVAQVAFTAVSLISLAFAIRVLVAITEVKFSLPVFLCAFAFTLLSFPGKFTLGMGQNNLIALSLLVTGYWLYKKKKLTLSGLVLGLSLSVKPVFLFLLVFFLLKKQWKVVLWSLLTVLILSVLVGVFSETNLFVYYIKEELLQLLNFSGREIYYNQGLTGFVSRLTPSIILRQYLTGLLSLAILMVTFLLTRNRSCIDIQLSLFVSGLLLVDTLSWQHHLVWMIFPLFMTVHYGLTSNKWRLLLLMVVVYILVGWNFKKPEALESFPQLLLLSHGMYGVLIMWGTSVYLLLKGQGIGERGKSF